MKVSRGGEWGEEPDYRVYRTKQGSSVVGWVKGRRPLATSEAKVFSSFEVGLDGILWKLGSWRKNWKQRFFVLRHDRLSYYESSKSLNLLGEVRLFDKQRVATILDDVDSSFSVKCATTGRELRLRAETTKDKDRWLWAMRDLIDRRGEGKNVLFGRSSSSPTDIRRILGIQASLHVTGVPSNASLFLVLFAKQSSGVQQQNATPPAAGDGKKLRDEGSGATRFELEEDYDSDKTDEDDPSIKLHLSPPGVIRANGRQWKEIARTEGVKAGDMGAFVCQDDTLVRQFSILLPAPANKWPEGALIAVYHRSTSGTDNLSRHHRLMSVELDPDAVYRRSRVILLRRHDGEENDEGRQGSLLLTGVDATGIEPDVRRSEFAYARQHYQFRSLVNKVYGHVLASEALCVPRCTYELPAALLKLVVSERTTLAHDIYSQIHDAAIEKRGVADELRAKVEEAAISAREKCTLRARAEADLHSLEKGAEHPAEVMRQRTKSMLFDEEAAVDRHRELGTLLSRVESLATELQAMEKELQNYAQNLDEIYSSRVSDILLATTHFDDEPPVGEGGKLANVHVAESQCRPFLKRSTQKKEEDLQFAPTNLNWHQLKARRLDDDKLVANSTVTFGATAAHSKQFGFKEGGLARLLDKVPAYSPPLATRQSKHYQHHSTLAAAWSAERPVKPSWFFSAPPSPPKEEIDKDVGLDRAVSRHLRGASEQRKTRSSRCLSLHLFGGLDAATVPVVEECCNRRQPDEEGESAAAFAARTSLASRVDVVLSQALALAGAHVEAVISRMDPALLERAVAPSSVDRSAGKIILGIECLLSTLNDELGMLEDLVVAAEWLSTLRFRFVRRRDSAIASAERKRGTKRLGRQADDDLAKWRVQRSTKGDGALVVDLVVENEVAAALERAADGRESEDEAKGTDDFQVIASTRIDCVLFSQGINEWQTVANNFGTAFVLQSDVNAVGLQRLRDHVEWAERVCRERALGDADRAAKVDATCKLWRQLLASASEAVLDSSTQKNVHLLLKTSDLCRELAGSHCICCKSGKDRTSMAVTLEQTRMVASSLGVFDEKCVCKLMRRHGVRRVNVIANTDQDKYAFNAVQVKSLPRCYRPPRGTYTGNTLT